LTNEVYAEFAHVSPAYYLGTPRTFELADSKHRPVGAAEGCDLLILSVKKNRSKDRSLRQLLHEAVR
jgi:hypothetical protein